MPCPQYVIDANDVLMAETQQDLDFPQCALTIRLVLKWADFLDSDTLVCHMVQSRAGCGGNTKKQVSSYINPTQHEAETNTAEMGK